MAQLGRKEWRAVSDREIRGVFRASSKDNNNSSNNNNTAMFSSSSLSDQSSDSDQLSAPAISIQPDDITIYEVKHVQQSNGSADISLGPMAINFDLSISDESLQQRLHDIGRQREQLQQLEIDLRTQFIARAEILRVKSNLDDQAKQHAGVVANLEEQIQERDNHIHDLEQQLEERQRQLHVNQLETSEAVNQVWAKDGLLREQNNELTSLRRECEAVLSEKKVAVAQFDAERGQHLEEIQELKEQLREKDRQIQEMEEQHRTVQDMLLYKDEQLREAQVWATRVQELDVIHINSSHSLQAELRDRTDQLNQLWLGCQRQLADTERYYLQTIQHLQIQLAEAREQNTCLKDGCHIDHLEEKRASNSDKAGQYDSVGEITSGGGKNGNSVGRSSNNKVEKLENGTADGNVPLIFHDMGSKADYAAGLPVAASPVLGMSPIFSSDPLGIIQQYGMHQQNIPQNMQPSSVQITQSAFGPFQSMPSMVSPQQLIGSRQNQQHQAMSFQQLPSRQQSHPVIQVGTKRILHPKDQDSQRHPQQGQGGNELAEAEVEQQKLKDEQEHNFSSLLHQEYSEHITQPSHNSPLKKQESEGTQIHIHFKVPEQSQQMEQEQLSSFSLQSQNQQLKEDSVIFVDDSQCFTNVQSSNLVSMEQSVPVSCTAVTASAGISYAKRSQFQSSIDQVNISENAEHQSSAESTKKHAMTDGYSKASDPLLLDERSLLACFVRVIPAEATARIRISSTLPNRLGKMLAPLHWHDYRRKYGRLDDFVTSHPELFVVEEDFVHLREGAHATISATAAVAKVAAAAAAAASPIGMVRMPTVAVTPVAQSQVHRLRKGAVGSSKDSKTYPVESSSLAQMLSTSSNQYHHLPGSSSKQSPNSNANGITHQSMGDSNTGSGDSRMNTAFSNRHGRVVGSASFVKQELANRHQAQESQDTGIDASAS